MALRTVGKVRDTVRRGGKKGQEKIVKGDRIKRLKVSEKSKKSQKMKIYVNNMFFYITAPRTLKVRITIIDENVTFLATKTLI